MGTLKHAPRSILTEHQTLSKCQLRIKLEISSQTGWSQQCTPYSLSAVGKHHARQPTLGILTSTLPTIIVSSTAIRTLPVAPHSTLPMFRRPRRLLQWFEALTQQRLSYSVRGLPSSLTLHRGSHVPCTILIFALALGLFVYTRLILGDSRVRCHITANSCSLRGSLDMNLIQYL